MLVSSVFCFIFHAFDFYLNCISASAAAKSVYFLSFFFFFLEGFLFNIEMLFIVVA